MTDKSQGLDKYYMRIFEHMDTFHKQDAARIFLTVLEATEPIRVHTFHIMLQNDAMSSAVSTELSLDYDWHQKSLVENVRKQLNGRCLDLLEIGGGVGNSFSIRFLHRTVKEFLQNEDLSPILRSRAGPNFNAQITLCSIYLWTIKHSMTFNARGRAFMRDKSLSENAYRLFLHHAQAAEWQDGITIGEAIKNMSESLADCWREDRMMRLHKTIHEIIHQQMALNAIAILEHNTTVSPRAEWLCTAALKPFAEVAPHFTAAQRQLLLLLLRLGCDPGVRVDLSACRLPGLVHLSTTWDALLDRLEECHRTWTGSNASVENEARDMVWIFIDHAVPPIRLDKQKDKLLQSVFGLAQAREMRAKLLQRSGRGWKSFFSW